MRERGEKCLIGVGSGGEEGVVRCGDVSSGRRQLCVHERDIRPVNREDTKASSIRVPFEA